MVERERDRERERERERERVLRLPPHTEWMKRESER